MRKRARMWVNTISTALMASFWTPAFAALSEGEAVEWPVFKVWFEEFQRKSPSGSSLGSLGSHIRVRDAWEAQGGALGEQIPVPVSMTTVAIVYSPKGIKTGLKLASDVAVDIFQGRIRNWDDTRIAKLNPGVKLPVAQPIIVVYRSDPAGTSAILSDYFSKVSGDWKAKLGAERKLKLSWGIAAKSDEALLTLVSQTPGAIGYIDRASLVGSVKGRGVGTAALQNANNTYVEPSAENSLRSLGIFNPEPDAPSFVPPQTLFTSITNPPHWLGQAYPIVGLNYILINKKEKKGTAESLKKFLNWILSAEGQAFSAKHGRPSLPKSFTERALKLTHSIEVVE